MNSFNDLMQEIVNMDYPELLKMARTSMEQLLPVFKAVDEKNDGVFAAIAVILAAVGADRKLTPLEKSFVCDLLHLEPDKVSNMIKMYNGEEEEVADKIADALDTEHKAAFISLIAAIAASDESIKADEIKFIKKLLV